MSDERFTTLSRIYKAYRTNVWWIMEVFRVHWCIFKENNPCYNRIAGYLWVMILFLLLIPFVFSPRRNPSSHLFSPVGLVFFHRLFPSPLTSPVSSFTVVTMLGFVLLGVFSLLLAIRLLHLASQAASPTLHYKLCAFNRSVINSCPLLTKWSVCLPCDHQSSLSEENSFPLYSFSLTLLVLNLDNFRRNKSIPQLLKFWLHASPGHPQPRYRRLSARLQYLHC